MKILCIGRKGNNRSVALAYLLKLHGHDAIAVGMRSMGKDTRTMLFEWADMIVFLHNKCIEGVPDQYMKKVKKCHVSCSEEPPAFDPDMIEWFKTFMKQENL